MRERAALLHEQLTDLRAEELDQRSLLISVFAFIFLPLTFITGLLGMNVEGIPYAQRALGLLGRRRLLPAGRRRRPRLVRPPALAAALSCRSSEGKPYGVR